MPDLLNWTGTTVPASGRSGSPPASSWSWCCTASWRFALSQTAWGRHVYAVGDDIEAARLAGIRVNAVLLSVYTVAGLIYGITAWILIGRAGIGQPQRV